MKKLFSVSGDGMEGRIGFAHCLRNNNLSGCRALRLQHFHGKEINRNIKKVWVTILLGTLVRALHGFALFRRPIVQHFLASTLRLPGCRA